MVVTSLGARATEGAAWALGAACICFACGPASAPRPDPTGEAAPAARPIPSGPTAEPIAPRLYRAPAAGLSWIERSEYHGRTVRQPLPEGRARVIERVYRMHGRVRVDASEPGHDVLRVEVLEHVHQPPGLPPSGLPAGAVLTLDRRVDRGRLSIDGAPAPPERLEELRDVLEVTLQREDRDDDVFWGADVPHAIGAPWAPPSGPIEASLGGTVDEASAVIDRVEDVTGVPCAIFVATIRARTPLGAATLRVEIAAPRDPTLPLLSYRSELHVVRETASERSESRYVRSRGRLLDPR